MNIFKSFWQNFWQGLKKWFLRIGKRILNVISQAALITGILIGVATAVPWVSVVWTIIASVIGVVVIFVFGLKIDFLLLLLIQFLLTVLAFYLIARKSGVWEKR